MGANLINRGGRRGILETEKPGKKSPKTAKPQEISEIKALANKALAVFRISLSVINFFFLHKNLFYFPNSKLYLRIPWLVQNTWFKKLFFVKMGSTTYRVNNLYCFYVKNPPKRVALWGRENSQSIISRLGLLCYSFYGTLVMKTTYCVS